MGRNATPARATTGPQQATICPQQRRPHLPGKGDHNKGDHKSPPRARPHVLRGRDHMSPARATTRDRPYYATASLPNVRPRQPDSSLVYIANVVATLN